MTRILWLTLLLGMMAGMLGWSAILPLLRIARPVRRSVPVLAVLRDSVVPPRRSHPSTPLVLKSSVCER